MQSDMYAVCVYSNGEVSLPSSSASKLGTTVRRIICSQTFIKHCEDYGNQSAWHLCSVRLRALDTPVLTAIKDKYPMHRSIGFSRSPSIEDVLPNHSMRRVLPLRKCSRCLTSPTTTDRCTF